MATKTRTRHIQLKKPVTVERTLYQIVALPVGEIVGEHEDKAVARIELERFELECRKGFVDGTGKRHRISHMGIPVTHELRERTIVCSDEDDGLPPAKGPIVSSGMVTERTLKRGVKPPDQLIRV